MPLLRDGAGARRADAAARGETFVFSADDYVEERVLFRHFDPRVLAQVLPALDEAQFARVLGPAALAVIPRGDGAPPLKAPALEPEVIAPQGPLRLTPEQMQAIADLRAGQSRLKLMSFLRSAAPDETLHKSDAELARDVLRYEASGKALGLATEQSHGRWCYLMASTQGEIERLPKVRRHIAAGPGTPDVRLEQLMSHMQLLAQSDLRRSG